MLPHIHLNTPLYIDFNHNFYNSNKLYKFDYSLHTFLIDNNDKIILVGNPTHNDKLMKLYKDEINKRVK